MLLPALLPWRFPVCAQQPYLRHFTVDEGLPSNECYRVTEAADGYLFVATDRGICRYDGYGFEPVIPKDKPGLTPVYDIYRGSSGALYFPGLEGKVYVYRQGLLALCAGSGQQERGGSIGLLIADAVAEAGGSLLVNYNDNAAAEHRLRPDGATVETGVPTGIHFDLERNFHYKTFDDRGRYATAQRVFITWPDGTRTETAVQLSWPRHYIRKPYHLRIRGIDLFCIGRQLLLYRDKRPVGRSLLSGDPLALHLRPDGSLLIGFEKGGLAVFSLEDTRLSAPLLHFLKPLSVSGIHSDFQGGLWISTLEDGLYYAYPSGALVWPDSSRIVSMLPAGNGCFVLHQDGKIRLLRDGRVAGMLRVPLPAGEELISGYFDEQQELMALTARHLCRYRQGRWQLWPCRDKVWLRVNDTLAYGGGVIDAVLHQYRLPGAEPVRTIALPKRILCMARDSATGIWLGTMKGLFHFDSGGLRPVTGGLPALQDRIVALSALEGGGLAAATLSDGLVLLRRGQQHLTTDSGLPSPVINSMQSAAGALWLGSNKGLTALRYLPGRPPDIRHYGSEAGLPSLDVHSFALSGGWLYLKWINSLVAIRLNALQQAAPSHRVSITAVTAGADTLRPGASIPYDRNNLTFRYNSISFAGAGSQQYRYRLAGFEDSWHSSTGRQASYTNLPPGSYRFEVQVAGMQPASQRFTASASFRILPAFWQRWWFLLCCLLAALGLLLLGFRLRLRAARRRDRLLLELAESQQKAMTQLISPHFLFNVLNTAQSYILTEDKLKAASLVAHISRLLRLSLEVTKESFVTLRQELELLRRYTGLEELRTPDKFRAEIDTTGLRDEELQIPGMLIQPFVENAIKHGIMHLQRERGLVRIQFSQQERVLVCTVTDNGIGRAAAAVLSGQHASAHRSIGIAITRRRLELLHKEQGLQLLFEIADLRDGYGQPTGTSVIFTIPFIRP